MNISCLTRALVFCEATGMHLILKPVPEQMLKSSTPHSRTILSFEPSSLLLNFLNSQVSISRKRHTRLPSVRNAVLLLERDEIKLKRISLKVKRVLRMEGMTKTVLFP